MREWARIIAGGFRSRLSTVMLRVVSGDFSSVLDSREFAVRSSCQHNTLPFDVSMLEVDNETKLPATHLEVVDHLATFDIRDRIDRLCVDDDLTEANQIRHVDTDDLVLVDNVKTSLLLARNRSQLKLNHKSILIDLLVESMADEIQNFHGAADDTIGFFPKQDACHGVKSWRVEGIEFDENTVSPSLIAGSGTANLRE